MPSSPAIPPPPSPFRTTVERLVIDPATPDLSLRQLAVLMIARDEPKTLCTVRGIAARLNISKPAITRATDRLHDLGFADRQVDKADRRSVFILATKKGRAFVDQLAGETAKVAAWPPQSPASASPRFAASPAAS